MNKVVRFALVGDFDPAVAAHRAIPRALQLSAARLQTEIHPSWVPTSAIDHATASPLSEFTAIWCVPGSPYASMDGALAAIRFARESPRPFLGTCGGFQHAIVEYFRNVLGQATADHAESAPNAIMPVVSRLSCSLVNKGGQIRLQDSSRLRTIYGSDQADEEYFCNFGVNPEYANMLTSQSGLRVAAVDPTGAVRAVELLGHPFFFGTLFQPERAALRGLEHPLVTAFVAAAINRFGGGQ
jgi:CTP synthase (UTP-ammonia lyase)